MSSTNVARVEKYRTNLRKSGLRPIQIWVPDTRKEGFDEECKRQSKLVAAADRKDKELIDFLNDALSDIDGWTA
jgi:G:T-mismatch repair DNA endonuclease (very short patch repair protein)